MQNIKDIPLAEFPGVVKALGLKPFAASQIIQWLYKKGAVSFDEMTNLSREARKVLGERFSFSRLKLKKTLESADGTKKFAWELEDGKVIESVLIPSEPYSKVPNPPSPPFKKGGKGGISTRLTLCISTQVGCAMGCSFCRTAGMGFVRNLTQGEIVGQILEAQRAPLLYKEGMGEVEDIPHLTSPYKGEEFARVTNVVLMGMGEPLANYDNVLGAIRIMTDTKGLNLSRRHVTLSTCGLIPGIERLAKDDPGIKLAISLNATTDEQREKIMPVNKKYSLAKLFDALKKYSAATKRSRMTFEYVMIDGFNDSNEDAKRLIKFLSCFPSKVNLIPLNIPYLTPSPLVGEGGRRPGEGGVILHSPSETSVQRFAQYLRNKHIQVNIRESRGQDILAACGQLAANT